MAGSNPISQGLYVDIITPDLWNTKEKNYFTFNNIKELNTPPKSLPGNFMTTLTVPPNPSLSWTVVS